MIAPYAKPRPHRPVAWLVDPSYAYTDDDRLRPLRDCLEDGVQVWGQSERLREFTRQGYGSAVLWRYQAIGWHPDRSADDWPVRGLALEAPADPREAVAALSAWRDWLESHGAAPAGSLGGSGMSLLKATIDRPIWTSAGALPPIKFTVGGRQEVVRPAPAHYECLMVQCDIAAAYAQTLGRARYGGSWLQLNPRQTSIEYRKADRSALVYLRVEIEIPDLPGLAALVDRRGPLVVRPRRQLNMAEALFWQREEDVYPAGKTIQGTWSLAELEVAEAAGCKIKRVRDVWLHAAEDQPFARWLDAVWEGRELGGFASKLAKATGNATWGQFAIAKGRRKIVAVGRDETRPLRGGNPSQRAFDLAEWIAGSVRADLYRGMLHAGPGLITAHTDGLWTRGTPVTGWRMTAEATEMRIFEAQCYAVRQGDDDWSYCVAGALDPAATFERMWDELGERSVPTPLEAAAGQTARADRRKVPVIR